MKTADIRRHIVNGKSDAHAIAHDHKESQFFILFKGGAVYVYSNVPAIHFEDAVTAKKRNKATAGETPGSEGSYLIHHIIGRRGQTPPFMYAKLDEAPALEVFPADFREEVRKFRESMDTGPK